jgi:hypothetical protein
MKEFIETIKDLTVKEWLMVTVIALFVLSIVTIIAITYYSILTSGLGIQDKILFTALATLLICVLFIKVFDSVD